MKEKSKFLPVLAIFLLLSPVSASANMVWPSLYIEEGMLAWYVIVAGIVIEFLFTKIFAKQTWVKSAIISVVMNAVSTIAGLIMIPLSGIVAEIIMIPFGGGTFQPSHWVAAYIMAVLCNVFIEGLTVKLIFKLNFKKSFLWLLAANALSVGIALCFMPSYY